MAEGRRRSPAGQMPTQCPPARCPQCTRPGWRLWRPLPPTRTSTTTWNSKPSSRVVCPRRQRGRVGSYPAGPSREEGQTRAGSHTGSPPGTDSATPLTMKKFISHATCHDSLALQEQETYLIMGQTSDLWRVKSEYVGASCCPWNSDLDPLPYPTSQSLVSKSLLHL